MLNLTATDVINIVTVLANIIISFVTYNVCKKNNNRSDILNSLIILCDDCENNLSSYWQKTMPHNDRVLLASAIKTNMKKVRSLLLVLGKQYLSKEEIMILQNDWNEIDKKATGGTFETGAFKIDKNRYEETSALILSFRTKVVEKKIV